MLNFSRKSAFGLDLSDLSFKIVQLKKIGTRILISSFIREDLPPGLVERGEIKKEEELATIIKKAVNKVKGEPLRSKRVICNLPEEKVFIRLIQLPQMKKSEIGQAVNWEAEAHIPLSLDEVYLDWQIIKSLSSQTDHTDVLIGASPRTLVDSYISLLKKSGLEPIALEPESVAVIRSLTTGQDFKPTIIVDLGVTGTNFVIVSALAIRFSSHIHISGQLFTQAIMKSLRIDQEKAEQLKIRIGLDKSKQKGRIYRALEPPINDLAKQIQEYITFYHSRATYIHALEGKAIEQVLLCGGDSLLFNLSAFLSQKLNLPVKVGNPLTNIYSTNKQKELVSRKRPFMSKKGSLSFTTALGLALREFK